MAADGSVVIEIIGDDKEFKSTLGSLGTVAGSALKGAATAVAAATTAVGGLAAASVKVGSNFESSMSQVAATMGLTTADIANGSEEFELLSQAAKDAGATTAFSASQASEALNYLALAGYDAQTAADALPAVLNLAAAGSMDLAYASDLATDAMAALGIEASNENLTQFGDEMAKTASKANTSVAQLGEAILTVGGTAKSLAGGTTELNAALGVLANRGIKGAEGGTALRNVILALSAPTDKAAASMKSLGLEVYDASGNMRPLNEIFKDLNASMENMSEGEKTQVLNEIFNKVDLKSAQALLAGCGDEFDNLADAIANSGGAMQDMADTQLDNLKGDLTILQSGLEGLGIAAYEGMQGPLREAVQLATSMVGDISAAFNEGGLTAAVGAVGDALADMVTYVAGLAPQMIDAGVGLLTSLISGIQQNLPALASGAVEIVTSLVNGIATMLPQLATTAVQLVTALANGIAAALPDLIPTAIQAVVTLVQGLIENIPALIEAAAALIQGLTDGVIAAIPILVAAIPTIITSLVTVLLENIPVIIQAGIDLLTALVGALPEIIAAIVAVLPQIIDGITTALLNNIPLLIEAGIQLLTALITNLPQIIATIVTAVPEIVSAIVSAFADLAGSIVDIGANIVSGIWDGICSMATWIKDKVTGFFSGIVDGVKDFLGIHSPSKVFAGIGTNTVEGYADGVDDGASANEKRVLNTVGGLSDSMADALGNGGGDAGAALMNKLTTSATASLAKVTNVASTSVATFCNGVTAELGKVQTTAENAMTTLCNAVLGKQTDVVAVANTTVTSICDTILSRHRDFYNVGVDAMSGFNEGLWIQGQQAIATARSIANAIIAEMQRAMDIHSPSRKMRDLVGVPTAQGFIVGFEDEMGGWGKRMQAAVNAETGKISVNAATQAEGRAASNGVTREVHTSTNTVEKVARLEGDGVTGELVRMLGLKLKEEDTRVGDNLED
nr:MAG TPA: minor tail protein [Caudoviricetes sp.]